MRNRLKNEGSWQSCAVTQIPDVSAESAQQSSTTQPAEVQRVVEEQSGVGQTPFSWLASGFYKIAFFALLGVMGAQLFLHLTRDQAGSNENTSQVSVESEEQTHGQEPVELADSHAANQLTDPAISSHLRKLLEQSDRQVKSKRQKRTQRLITAQRPGSNIQR